MVVFTPLTVVHPESPVSRLERIWRLCTPQKIGDLHLPLTKNFFSRKPSPNQW